MLLKPVVLSCLSLHWLVSSIILAAMLVRGPLASWETGTVKQPKVTSGTLQALYGTSVGREQQDTPFLDRYILLNKEKCDDAPMHIAVHLVTSLADAPPPYVHAHAHPSCDEIGLVIGQPDALEYEIILDENVHTVGSPGSIFIPAGTVHRATALRGSGVYVCIVMDPQGANPANTVKPD